MKRSSGKLKKDAENVDINVVTKVFKKGRFSVKAETAIYTAYDGYQIRDSAEAERNLMRAVLRSAMEDLRKSGEPYRDAKRYFLAADEQYLFSFRSVCSHLNLCPKTMLAVLGLNDELYGKQKATAPG